MWVVLDNKRKYNFSDKFCVEATASSCNMKSWPYITIYSSKVSGFGQKSKQHISSTAKDCQIMPVEPVRQPDNQWNTWSGLDPPSQPLLHVLSWWLKMCVSAFCAVIQHLAASYCLKIVFSRKYNSFQTLCCVTKAFFCCFSQQLRFKHFGK